MDYRKIAEEILELLGGKSNVRGLGNCYTRVRAEVKDIRKCKIEECLQGALQIKTLRYAHSFRCSYQRSASVRLIQLLSLQKLLRKHRSRNNRYNMHLFTYGGVDSLYSQALGKIR